MTMGSARITKRRWYNMGGFANPLCWRRHNGYGWRHFIRVD